MRIRFSRERQHLHQALVGEIEKRLGETIEQSVAMRLGWLERIEVAGLEAIHCATIGRLLHIFNRGNS